MSFLYQRQQLKEKELRAAMACHSRNKKRDKSLASRRKNNNFEEYAKELLYNIKNSSSNSSSSSSSSYINRNNTNNMVISLSHDQNLDNSNNSSNDNANSNSSSSVNTGSDSSQCMMMSNDNDDHDEELLRLISDALEHEYLINQMNASDTDLDNYGIDGMDTAIEEGFYMEMNNNNEMGEDVRNLVFCPACQQFSMSILPSNPINLSTSFVLTTGKGTIGCFTNGCILNKTHIQLDHCQEIINNDEELNFFLSSIFDRHSHSCSGLLTINPQFYQNIIFFVSSCNQCQFQENLFFPSNLRII